MVNGEEQGVKYIHSLRCYLKFRVQKGSLPSCCQLLCYKHTFEMNALKDSQAHTRNVRDKLGFST